MSGQTPSLAEVIRNAIESRLVQLHTMMPGIVTAVDLAKGVCEVQPSLQRLGIDGEPITLPKIPHCPIGFYRAGTAAIYLPIKIGSKVEIRFCERSLDIWLTKGGTVDPEDKRKHHLSDAVAYPGMYDLTDPPIGADPDNIVITQGSGKIVVAPTGKFQIQGASDELLTVISDFFTRLLTIKVTTVLGPQPILPIDVTDLQAIITRLAGLKV